MYIEYINGRAIEHYGPSEINQIELPKELLESLARALVPDFQAYVQAQGTSPKDFNKTTSK